MLSVAILTLAAISSAVVGVEVISLSDSNEIDANLSKPIKSDGDFNWNQLADAALDLVREQLILRGEDQIKIPNITTQFSTKVQFITISGNFSAYRGYFNDLSTVRRTGDVSVVHSGNQFVLRCSLGLGVIRMGYDNYEIKINHLGPKPKGHLDGSVGSNSIQVTIAFAISPDSCNATLTQFKVVELKDLKLKVTGFGVFNNIVSKKANEAIEKNKGEIVKRIELNLGNVISSELAKLQCSQFMSVVLMKLNSNSFC